MTTLTPPPLTALTVADETLLEDLAHRSFLYFLEQADPQTGWTYDRADADGTPRSPSPASIAAIGFGLTAYCIGVERGWIDRPAAIRRTRMVLRTLLECPEHFHGFLYHFIDAQSGARAWKCEISSIDTALLLAGALTVRAYFPEDAGIGSLAQALFDRVDWRSMLDGGLTLSMGYKPRRGFLPSRWDQYSEMPILYLLAMGSSTHPLPAGCWDAWRREPLITYGPFRFMACPPLFTHQFSHAWIDFRDRRDRWTDYWDNSVQATSAQRQMFIDLAKKRPRTCRTYHENCWGLTASDSPRGYRAWGGPPATRGIDGTVVPCAAAGSLPFLPRQCLDVLHHLKDEFGPRIYRRYGFVDAFNPRTGWTGPDVIGIDVGITLLMIENLRSGLVWETFMCNPEIQRGMDAAGFTIAPHRVSVPA